MRTKNFTTTLSIPIIDWLNEFSEETNRTKKEDIEKALSILKKEHIKYKIKESYKKASKDYEWMELGNIGVNEWEANIREWEK